MPSKVRCNFLVEAPEGRSDIDLAGSRKLPNVEESKRIPCKNIAQPIVTLHRLMVMREVQV